MQIELFYDGLSAGTFAAEKTKTIIPVTPAPGAKQLEIRFSIPVRDIQQYWHPELSIPSRQLLWKIGFCCGAQYLYPFCSFFNMAGENRAAFYLTDLWDDTRIQAAMNQQNCTYDVCVTTALSPETAPFLFVLDRSGVPWTRTLEEWRQLLQLPAEHFPEAAWEPVFCTWYAVHGSVTAPWVEANARIAAELGFHTLIVDDGWSYDECKRVTPQTLPDWYDTIGDWQVSAQKFPDFDSHVRRVQAMGLRYMLWVTPFLWGRKSRLLKEFPGSTFDLCHEGCYHFRAECREPGDAMIARLASLMKEHPIDGLKIDFLDITRNDPTVPNGRDTLRFIRSLSAALRSCRADALLEFRQGYATPAMLPYGTQFRAGDTPFDYLVNFARLVQIRLGLGSLGPVHADPAYWAPDELPVNISRHMIAMLVGVPMLSMDLTRLSETEKKIICHWIKFYNDHKAVLNHGKWSFRFAPGTIEEASVENGEERIRILCAPLPQEEPKYAGTTHILNLSPGPLTIPGTAVFDETGLPGRSGVIVPGGRGILNARAAR